MGVPTRWERFGDMFNGEYRYSMDDKGRVAVPTKFKAELKEGAVVTRGLDNCLVVYPKGEWEKLATRISGLPISQSNNRAFARLMLAGAMDVPLDKQGRIMVPDYLRKYAGLDKAVVIAGLYNRLEVWGAEAWDRYSKQTEASSGDIAERLGELGV